MAIGLGALTWSATVWDDDPSSAAPGAPLSGLDATTSTAFQAGKALFEQVWSPHAEYYNGRSCAQCHRDPGFAGTSSSPFDFAFFSPEPSDPTGFKPFPWLRFKNGRPAGQRLPFGEFEVRRPQALYGLGLLEAIPTDAILAQADPTDKNRDGVSGRLIRVEGAHGRFGWRATAPTLAAFVRSAFENEMGLRMYMGGGKNQLMPESVDAVTQTLRLLAPPRPRPTKEAAAGRLVFERVGCGTCHTPTWTTGTSDVALLANRRIAPYTDLLVHDVARGKPQPVEADQLSRREFRTPPLWGLGLHDGPFWHDGSTATLDEAVDRHEGEGLAVRDRWRKLPSADHDALLKFLKSL